MFHINQLDSSITPPYCSNSLCLQKMPLTMLVKKQIATWKLETLRSFLQCCDNIHFAAAASSHIKTIPSGAQLSPSLSKFIRHTLLVNLFDKFGLYLTYGTKSLQHFGIPQKHSETVWNLGTLRNPLEYIGSTKKTHGPLEITKLIRSIVLGNLKTLRYVRTGTHLCQAKFY